MKFLFVLLLLGCAHQPMNQIPRHPDAAPATDPILAAALNCSTSLGGSHVFYPPRTDGLGLVVLNNAETADSGIYFYFSDGSVHVVPTAELVKCRVQYDHQPDYYVFDVFQMSTSLPMLVGHSAINGYDFSLSVESYEKMGRITQAPHCQVKPANNVESTLARQLLLHDIESHARSTIGGYREFAKLQIKKFEALGRQNNTSQEFAEYRLKQVVEMGQSAIKGFQGCENPTVPEMDKVIGPTIETLQKIVREVEKAGTI